MIKGQGHKLQQKYITSSSTTINQILEDIVSTALIFKVDKLERVNNEFWLYFR